MFLFYLIFVVFLNRIYAINRSIPYIAKLEDLYPLPTNEHIDLIAEQFNQNANWELGNIPVHMHEDEEITPIEPTMSDLPTGPGTIKTGHLFVPDYMHPYPIDTKGVHRQTEHHIFLVRHGLYYYSEYEPSSHLLRYGKYQARMAGHKIDQQIYQILRRSGALTRPIKLVSSTQTRALETLYNIRLQLNNEFEFEPDIIQDSGLTECIDEKKQRIRWIYFVREYLQPIKSNQRENTITIIAAHGNLLTAFDYIIQNFISPNRVPLTFETFHIPTGVAYSHAQVQLYRTVGTTPISFERSFIMSEIPITINHAQLRKDMYYEWAAKHQCRSKFGLGEMKNYIRSGILDTVFSRAYFINRISNFETIVYWEMMHEYETHILPIIMRTCRNYLYRLSHIQVNADFGSFTRLMSPVPIPASEEEQKSPLKGPTYQFTAYSLPFTVKSDIQHFRKNPVIQKLDIPSSHVHSNSRDEKTSYLTRLGINQIRGVMSHVHGIIFDHIRKASEEIRIFPINIISEPSVEAAESCFHIRTLLQGGNYTVAEQITDLGLQFNYFQKRNMEEFVQFQRVQVLYMYRQYLTPDVFESKTPSLQIHILCGDGRLFTAFRHEMASNNLLAQPYQRFPTFSDPTYNDLKHANGFFFEAIGDETLKLHDTLSLVGARGIHDDQKVATQRPLELPRRELLLWLHSRSGPCVESYFLNNTKRLSAAIVHANSYYQNHIARLIRKEWHPYLAGLFIYACRYHLTLLDPPNLCEQQGSTNVMDDASAQCNEQASANAGPSGENA